MAAPGAAKKSATATKKVTRRQQQFLRPYLTPAEVQSLYRFIEYVEKQIPDHVTDDVRNSKFELGRFL